MRSGIKYHIERYFKRKWKDTLIEFEGAPFIANKEKPWISLIFRPYDREVVAFNGQKGRKVEYVMLTVMVFAPNPAICHKVARDVREFIECTSINGTITVGVGKGDGNGVNNIDNGVYAMAVNFDIKEYED